MRRIEKIESAVGDNMRSDKKEIEEKVKKEKCSLNGSKTLQDKKAKVIESGK